jgi:hypothetical protein
VQQLIVQFDDVEQAALQNPEVVGQVGPQGYVPPAPPARTAWYTIDQARRTKSLSEQLYRHGKLSGPMRDAIVRGCNRRIVTSLPRVAMESIWRNKIASLSTLRRCHAFASLTVAGSHWRRGRIRNLLFIKEGVATKVKDWINSLDVSTTSSSTAVVTFSNVSTIPENTLVAGDDDDSTGCSRACPALLWAHQC